jgi:uncharacterized Zn-binding protein involved in type VI secretion
MLPAARITDMHTCPMWTGIVPHVGGPIVMPGAPTVIVGGLPAATVGSMVTCTGPPDTVASGAPTVLFGGKPAARLTDLTAHGGVIVAGCPTVLIGGAAPPTPPPPPPPPKNLRPDEVEFMKTGKTPEDLAQRRYEERRRESKT